MQTYRETLELAGSDRRGAPRLGVSPLAAALASLLRDARRVADFLESRVLDEVGPAERGCFSFFFFFFFSLPGVEHLSHMNNCRVYRGVWKTWSWRFCARHKLHIKSSWKQLLSKWDSDHVFINNPSLSLSCVTAMSQKCLRHLCLPFFPYQD